MSGILEKMKKMDLSEEQIRDILSEYLERISDDLPFQVLQTLVLYEHEETPGPTKEVHILYPNGIIISKITVPTSYSKLRKSKEMDLTGCSIYEYLQDKNREFVLQMVQGLETKGYI